ncbi:unnamed protein product [Aphanomyces euteiches]
MAYYVLGIPFGMLLAFHFNLGVEALPIIAALMLEFLPQVNVQAVFLAVSHVDCDVKLIKRNDYSHSALFRRAGDCFNRNGFPVYTADAFLVEIELTALRGRLFQDSPVGFGQNAHRP